MKAKQLLLTLFALLATSTAWADVQINETNFPDGNFREWLLQQQYGADGLLTNQELASVTSMEIDYGNVQSLTGIEYFTELTYLFCNSNKLTTLDLSNQKKLERLSCAYNQLTRLNVSNSMRLETLKCNGNKLTELDLSKCYRLTELYCDTNRLTTLDLSKCEKIKFVSCSRNSIKGAGMSRLLRSLPTYEWIDEELSNKLNCVWSEPEGNIISTIQVAAARAKGWVPQSYHSTSYNWGNLPVIDEYFAPTEGSSPTPVPINQTYFPDDNFRLSVHAYNINSDNELSASEIANVKFVYVAGNNIQSLEGIENFTAMTELDCSNNQIQGDAMDALVWALPTVSNGQLKVINGSADQNVMTTVQVAVAKAKGWTPLANLSGSWQEYGGSEAPLKGIAIDATNFPDEYFRAFLLEQEYGADGLLTEGEMNTTRDMYIGKSEISSLKGIEFFTGLTTLNIGSNPLTELDLSANTELEYVTCPNSQLTSLNVSECTALKQLNCSGNQLTSLDVTACTKLDRLDCCENQLTTLDLSHNSLLTWVFIYKNNIRGAGMDALVESLPVVNHAILYVMWNSLEQNVMTTTQVAAAKAKGWVPCTQTYNGMQEYPGSDPNGISVDEENFPDENFRQWLLSQTYAADGVLSASETTDITTLLISNLGIQRLKGIEYFPAVTTINCSQNQIKGEAMDELVELLPTVAEGYLNVIHYESEHNLMTRSQVAAAKAKGWTPRYNIRPNYWTWYEYEGSADVIPPVPYDIDINEENFPDANFRSYLLSQTYGADNVLSGEELVGISSISVNNKYIYNLKGIELFPNLQYLYCYQNYLTSLDLSQNTALQVVWCFSNQLTSLNVSGCKDLATLDCNDNQLTRLDVSGCTALTNLYCYKNKIKDSKMDSLVMSMPVVSEGIMNVVYDDYSERNVMTKSQVAAAKSKGWAPRYYNRYAYKWQDYEGSDDPTPPTPAIGIAINEENFPDEVFRNFLYGETFGADSVLTEEEIATIISINVTNKWIYNLKGIEYFTNLKYLYCYQNCLSSLDLSKNTALKQVWCSANRLTALNVSGCKELTLLDCNANRLTSLNVSDCTALASLYCYKNEITDSKMDSLVMSLPVVSEGIMNVVYEDYSERNVMTKSQVAAAKKKGWVPQYWDSHVYKWLEYEGIGTGIEPIVVETEVAMSSLGDEDITDNVVDDIYYNLAEESGSGYSSELNCLVIGQTTDMSQTGSGEPGSEEVKENFTGIIFEVGSGPGTVFVESEALGATRLAVRIGNDTPFVLPTGGRKNLYVSYNVEEPTYIYIYAVSSDASSAKAWRAPQIGENALLVYGIKIIPSNSGDAIKGIESEQPTIGNEALWFDLSGKPISKPRQSGIYIKNGKKIVVK